MVTKMLCVDSCLLLSGLSMDRIGKLQLDKRIRKRERTGIDGRKRDVRRYGAGGGNDK